MHTHTVLRHIVQFLQMVYDFLSVRELSAFSKMISGICCMSLLQEIHMCLECKCLNSKVVWLPLFFYYSMLSGKHICKAWRAITQEHEHISGDRLCAGNSWPITHLWCHAKHYRCTYYKCKVTVMLLLCIFICVEAAENMSCSLSRARLALWLNIFTNPETKNT